MFVHPLLHEANKIVNGPRNRDYGVPAVSHSRTAALWNIYLGPDGRELTPEDVCILNILQKISRHAHSPKHDNLVDIVGWALNAHIVGDYDDDARPNSGSPGVQG